MDIEEIRLYCLQKPGVTESFPFDEETLVFKVGSKMFLLASLEKNVITVKCEPEKAIDLRDRYPFVAGAFHMNKAMWNSVDLAGMPAGALLREWIDDSYALVKAKLTRKERESL
jgi:predicted DNA-binding protein (MmcQ/YjbR family)